MNQTGISLHPINSKSNLEIFLSFIQAEGRHNCYQVSSDSESREFPPAAIKSQVILSPWGAIDAIDEELLHYNFIGEEATSKDEE